MQILSDTLERLRIGSPRGYRNLWAYPLLGEAACEQSYYLLDEALRMPGFSVGETSEAGSVPDLLVRNGLERPVLLIDGEEVVGAKQNRVVNLTVMVPPHSQQVIPVSCVEAGRWSYSREELSSEERTLYAAARASKARQVTDSMESCAAYSADHGALWDDIEHKARRMSASSDTGAMGDIFDQYRRGLDAYTEAMKSIEDQLGVVFTIGARVMGMDLLGAPGVLRAILPKLTRGYALDACEAETGERLPPGEEAVSAFLCTVGDSPVLERPALGLGHDLRLRDERVAGGGLVYEGGLVHLYAFPVGAREGHGSRYRPGRTYR